MGRAQKEAIVNDLKGKISQAQSVVFTSYKGLTVAQMTELRNFLREKQIEYRVAKNNLIKIAVDESLKDRVGNIMEGPTGLVLTKDDPFLSTKMLFDFAKKNNLFKINGGIFDGVVLDSDSVKELSKIHSKAHIYGQLVSILAAPISGFLSILNAPAVSLLGVLTAIGKSKEEKN